MKTKNIKWKDNNDVRFIFEGERETQIDVTLGQKGINKLKNIILPKSGFVTINESVSINLDKVKYIIYKVK